MIRIISPGLFSSVQDSGRRGYRRFGVPVSGAMDPYAYKKGNRLLGNDPFCASIEITGPGFQCAFEADALISITGADLVCSVNNNPVKPGDVIGIKAGDILGFANINAGLRAYLNVRGGIDTPVRMGGRSMFRGERLKKDDRLGIGVGISGTGSGYYSNSYIEENGDYVIMVRWGQDSSIFPKKYLDGLLQLQYTVSPAHDRMGIRLDSMANARPHNKSIVTKPVFPGCIQMPGDGNPIIIMNDGQTAGGYPVWAVIESDNLRIAGQLKSGDRIKFLHV